MIPSSASVILDIAREQQRATVQQANDLDTKATALLGFAGLLLGLLFSSDLAATHWNALLTLGAVLLALALFPLGSTLYPRTLDSNPNLAELVSSDVHREPADVTRLIAFSLLRSISADSKMVRVKSSLVRGGSVLVAAAVLLIAGRLLYVLETTDPAALTHAEALSLIAYTYSHHA